MLPVGGTEACASLHCRKLATRRTLNYGQLLCTRHARGRQTTSLPKDHYVNESERLTRLVRLEAAQRDTLARLFASDDKSANIDGCFVVRVPEFCRTAHFDESGNDDDDGSLKHTHQSHIITVDSLSPSLLGPLVYNRGRGRTIRANSLHNFILSLNCYRFEESLPSEFLARQSMLCASTKVWRHKFGQSVPMHSSALLRLSALEDDDKDCHTPLYWLFTLHNDVTLRLGALQQRTVFCSFYEHLVRRTVAYARLVRLHHVERSSLLLVGPGARVINYALILRDFSRFFRELDQPFGHEMVLLAMLYCERLPVEQLEDALPWRYHWRELNMGTSFDAYYARGSAVAQQSE